MLTFCSPPLWLSLAHLPRSPRSAVTAGRLVRPIAAAILAVCYRVLCTPVSNPLQGRCVLVGESVKLASL